MSLGRTAAGAAALVAIGVVVINNPLEPEAMSLASSRGEVHGYGEGFEITGVPVKGLHPGAAAQVRLTIVNPARNAIRVTEISGSVASSSKPACKPKAENLTVRRYDGRLPLEVPGRGKKAAGSLELYMPHAVAQACAGSTFKIKMTGKAVKE